MSRGGKVGEGGVEMRSVVEGRSEDREIEEVDCFIVFVGRMGRER